MVFRTLPLAAAVLGLMLAGISVVPAGVDADSPAEPAAVQEIVRTVQRGDYTVERTIWIDARVVADPEALADRVAGIEPGSGGGIATAQYKINSHKWASANIPVPVHYNAAGQGTNPDAGGVIQGAVTKWNAVTPTKFTFTWMGTTTRGTGACDDEIDADGFNTVAYATGLESGVLGSTCTLFKGPNAPIEEFDMVLDAGTPWSVAASTAKGKYDLPSTILHELGHAAGIRHPCETKGACTATEKLAVMFAFLDDGEQRRTLTADDEAALRAQYPGGEVPTPSPTPAPSPTPVVVPPFSRSFQSVMVSIARD
ncbi:MAG: hypothetical protein C0506_10015 [Anaerolinea sp.]|nr:hypothetical protein [Anaerolinea sp.]